MLGTAIFTGLLLFTVALVLVVAFDKPKKVDTVEYGVLGGVNVINYTGNPPTGYTLDDPSKNLIENMCDNTLLLWLESVMVLGDSIYDDYAIMEAGERGLL